MKSCAGTSGIASDAVTDREQRDLRAFEQLLDDEAAAESRHRPQGVVELGVGPANVDALPGRKAVGLHHTGRPGDRKLRRRRNAGGRQHVLGEGLGAFDRRRGRARPEDRDARRTKHVGDSADERRLWPDHHEVDVERMGEGEETLRVLGANRMALGETRDARASRGGMEIGQGRGLRELPGERVLAPARTDQESTHRTSLDARSELTMTHRA